MPTLSQVILYGTAASMPAAGSAGRLFFTTDTKQVYEDSGSAWVNVSPSGVSITPVPLAPSAPGNFTVAHGLGAAPVAAPIEMTSGGAIWFQTPGYDATNLYLVASDAGVTGRAQCFVG
jgi:hypothetical protein